MIRCISNTAAILTNLIILTCRRTDGGVIFVCVILFLIEAFAIIIALLATCRTFFIDIIFVQTNAVVTVHTTFSTGFPVVRRTCPLGSIGATSGEQKRR
jgi:hypothetical protein